MTFLDAGHIAMDITSHKTVLVSRMPGDNFVMPMVAPITSHVKSRLASRLRNEEQSRQLDLYKYLAGVPKSRCLAGILYESMPQKIFQENIELELAPLVKIDLPRATNSRSGILAISLWATMNWKPCAGRR